MLNPLSAAFSVMGRFVRLAAPKPEPAPDPEARQGLQSVPDAR
jgi:hypothetical protein